MNLMTEQQCQSVQGALNSLELTVITASTAIGALLGEYQARQMYPRHYKINRYFSRLLLIPIGGFCGAALSAISLYATTTD